MKFQEEANKSDEWIVKRVAETLCQNRNEIILITSAQSLSNFHSKLAGFNSLLCLLNIFTTLSPATLWIAMEGMRGEKRAIIGFILNRESII